MQKAPRRRILFTEPFYGGSHKDVADGLAAHSRHLIDLVTLPDRFWKWRMRGAALALAAKIKSPQSYDVLMSSSMMSLADLKALWGGHCPPALVYFHENQLSYPLADGEEPDYQFGFTNISTALAADCLLFNSDCHRQAFLAALPGFLRMMPDCRPNWVKQAIAQKASVVYPGCHFDSRIRLEKRKKDQPPLIIWNHRWEHDKNPDAFFRALEAVHNRGLEFKVALLGQAYGRQPPPFEAARSRLGRRIVQFGHAETRRAYYQWLARGAIVISTALQENFGIAVVEAMAHGCLPLLPNRLSYPEILPRPFHTDFLYTSQEDLESRLANLLMHFDDYEQVRHDLAAAMAVYAWPKAVKAFDLELDRLSSQSQRPSFKVQS